MSMNKRVLIVEPDTAFALSLASLFREDGLQTGVAADAARAEREIAARSPDLVLVRAELPGASGFSLCGRLRREVPDLPVIVFSSDATPDALAEHARTIAAADGYLLMPLDTDALRQLTRSLLVMAEPLELADADIVEDDAVIEIEPEQDCGGIGGGGPPGGGRGGGGGGPAPPPPPPGAAAPPPQRGDRRGLALPRPRLPLDRRSEGRPRGRAVAVQASAPALPALDARGAAGAP